MGVPNDLTQPNMKGFLRKGLSVLKNFAQSTTTGQENLALIDQLERIQDLTAAQLKDGEDQFYMLAAAGEEFGELALAIRVEAGMKDRELTEPAKNEAIDLMICAVNLYFATGGKIEDLTSIMESKLDKWEGLC